MMSAALMVIYTRKEKRRDDVKGDHYAKNARQNRAEGIADHMLPLSDGFMKFLVPF